MNRLQEEMIWRVGLGIVGVILLLTGVNYGSLILAICGIITLLPAARLGDIVYKEVMNEQNRNETQESEGPPEANNDEE